MRIGVTMMIKVTAMTRVATIMVMALSWVEEQVEEGECEGGGTSGRSSGIGPEKSGKPGIGEK
jgi:hypothetical protein